MSKLTEQHIATIKNAAKKLTGAKRRGFQAQVTLDYINGKTRQSEVVFGWSRKTVELGLHELRTGITCIDVFSDRGNRKTEEKQPQLEKDICSLAEPKSQVDPTFQSPFKYTRMTAKAMRQALIDKKGWKDKKLPCEKTIGNIMNRIGYRLRHVQKSRPVKRIKKTNAIFENVHEENEKSDNREDSLRISIDTKAKVDLGDFSRGGQLRGKEAPQAYDHDFHEKKNDSFWHFGCIGWSTDYYLWNIPRNK